MMRSINIACKTGQQYVIVTYDLGVAKKAYAIQQIERPLFDDLLILLGNFHIELAFCGGVGTFIRESGIEFILTEADILAEGSVTGFINEKFYNRCKRVHGLVANVLEKKCYEHFLLTVPEAELEAFHYVMNTVQTDPTQLDSHLQNPVVTKLLEKYEEYFYAVMDGSQGSMAQYWGIYIYLINSLHRELQRCVKANNVKGYINIFPKILDVFFFCSQSPNLLQMGNVVSPEAEDG